MPFQIASTNFMQLIAALPAGPCWEIDGDTTYASKSFLFGVEETTNQDIIFSSDGTNMYVVGDSTQSIYQYTLGTPWDIETSNYASEFFVGSEELLPTGIAISSDGASMFLVGTNTDAVYQYALSTPYDISTAPPHVQPTKPIHALTTFGHQLNYGCM